MWPGLAKRTDGVVAFEYALVGLLVTIACLYWFQAVGLSLRGLFALISDSLDSAIPPIP